MKSEKGISLISLTIYIIAVLAVLGIVGVVSGFFYNTLDVSSKNIDPLAEFTRFNTYFSDEINHENIKVLEYGDDYVVFDNGVQYSFVAENKGIYKNNVKIANAIESCTFSHRIKNGKDVIDVTLNIAGTTRETTYTLVK